MELLIDGYNLIRQSAHLSSLEGLDLERGRQALLDKLAGYRRIKGHRITVVFDGRGSFHLGSRDASHRGINVVFTKSGEIADEWIKRRLAELREGAVVTSDREIRSHAEKVGVPSISSGDFERKMEEALYADLKGIEIDEGGPPMYAKKGPARRLSKRERKIKSIWKRL